MKEAEKKEILEAVEELNRCLLEKGSEDTLDPEQLEIDAREFALLFMSTVEDNIPEGNDIPDSFGMVYAKFAKDYEEETGLFDPKKKGKEMKTEEAPKTEKKEKTVKPKEKKEKPPKEKKEKAPKEKKPPKEKKEKPPKEKKGPSPLIMAFNVLAQNPNVDQKEFYKAVEKKGIPIKANTSYLVYRNYFIVADLIREYGMPKKK